MWGGYDGLMKLLLCAGLATAALCAQTYSASPLLDQTMEQAIKEDRIPGAVLLIGHKGQVVYRKAYGKRALAPASEDMTVDTIFDLRLADQSDRHHLIADEALRGGQVPPERSR